VVTLVVGFLLAPFVVHRLGNTGYGAWTLVTSLTGYFGMLDLGTRQSVGRFVARYMALNDDENVNRTISNALAMLGVAGVIGLLATVTANFSFGIFHIEQHSQTDARIALLIAGVTICLALPMSVSNAVLFSMERFDIVTGITVMGALTRSTLVVLALSRGHGLIALALITLLSSCAEYLSAAVCAKKLYPCLKPRFCYVEFARCKELFSFGIYRFIWIVANQLIFYTDSVVIGLFLNVAAITYYAIAGSLINYGRNIVSLAADTFYPAATRLDARNDTKGLQDLLILGTRIALTVGLPICLGFLFLGKQFIILWMGPAYAISAIYLIVLTIPQFSSMSQYISALILVGMAKHKALAYVTLAEGIANLILSIILVRKIGLIGVAWGTVIPHAISTALVIPFFTLHAVKMKWSEYVIKGFVRPIVAAIPAALLCYAFSIWVVALSWFVFGLEVLAVGVTSAVLSYYVCLSPGQRSMIIERIRKSPRREEVSHVVGGTV
jgi:O-antigen/teichoic acid export membrane protein